VECESQPRQTVFRLLLPIEAKGVPPPVKQKG
jgi:nitrogen-specific signal transduction histidine kinase